MEPEKALALWEAMADSAVSRFNRGMAALFLGDTDKAVAELTEATDNATTLVQPQATVTKGHMLIPFSIEVGEDWPSLEAEFLRLVQDAKDDEEGYRPREDGETRPPRRMPGNRGAAA